MKVLMIASGFPKSLQNDIFTPSTDLMIISSLVKAKGCEVKFIDMIIDNLEGDDIKAFANDFNPDIILIDSVVLTHCTALKAAKICKDMWSDSIIVLSGEVAKVEPESTLSRCKNIDVVLGIDGEISFLEVLSEVERGSLNFKGIRNITYRNSEGLIVKNIHESISNNLDYLPIPDYALFDYKKYLKKDSEMTIRSSRGCPGNCAFCNKTKLSKLKLFSIDRFIYEMKILLNKGFESFFISDETFTFSVDRLKEFSDKLNKENLKVKYVCNTRLIDISEETLTYLKKSGCYRVFIGVETSSEESSAKLGKTINEKKLLEKIDLIRKYGIQVHTSFIVGVPGDTEKNLEMTIDLVKKINPTLASFNRLFIFPGTNLYNNPESYDIIMEDKYWYESEEWTRETTMGTKQLPPEKIKCWYNKLQLSYIMNK